MALKTEKKEVINIKFSLFFDEGSRQVKKRLKY